MRYKNNATSKIPFTEKTQDKINLHENRLVKIETILERVAKNQEKTAETIQHLSISIQEQERLSGEIETLHTKINKVKQDVAGVIFFTKHPKLMLWFLGSLYLLLLPETRSVIVSLLKIGG